MQNRVTEILDREMLDAILVSDGYNMRYLSGFRGATGYLLISRTKKLLFTDSRYTTQAVEEASDFETIEMGGGRSYGVLLAAAVAEQKIRMIGYEDTAMLCGDFARLQGALKEHDCEWKPLGEALNILREIKTEQELEYIAKAEAIGDAAFSHILGELKPGVTELEIAAKMEYFMKMQGATHTSFDTIVASGLHSSMPHAIPSTKKLEQGDLITLDFGCLYEGYASDMTRTVVLGKANPKQKEIYGIVLEAQLAALDAIEAGKTGSEIDAISRGIIAKAGYGEYFGHGLGHSLGLYIHENPRLSPSCHDILRENMLMTVEPGIYIPGVGGVRIEDLVVVKEGGSRNLSHSKKELIEL